MLDPPATHKGGHALAVEAQSGTEQDRGGEYEARQPRLLAHRRGQPLVDPGNEVPAHLQQEERGRGEACDEHAGPEPGDLRLAGRPLAVGRLRRGFARRLGRIAGSLDCADEGRRVRAPLQQPDQRTLVGQVDLCRERARDSSQGALHAADPAGAGQAADRQLPPRSRGARSRPRGSPPPRRRRVRRGRARRARSPARLTLATVTRGTGRDGLLDPADAARADHAQDGDVQRAEEGGFAHGRLLNDRRPPQMGLPVMGASRAHLAGAKDLRAPNLLIMGRSSAARRQSRGSAGRRTCRDVRHQKMKRRAPFLLCV